MHDEKVDAHWATPLALAEYSRKIQPCHAERRKHLGTPRTRPFTELTLSGTNGLRVTIQGSSKSDTKKKQQEAAADEAILRLYHDESLKNTLHRCHQ